MRKECLYCKYFVNKLKKINKFYKEIKLDGVPGKEFFEIENQPVNLTQKQECLAKEWKA